MAERSGDWMWQAGMPGTRVRRSIMQPTSLNSVRITSVDPGTVLAALEAWARQIRRSRPEILAIGYFGSYANDRYGPGSDLDVLVVLSHSPLPRFFDRSPDLYPSSFPVGMDIFAYTTEEIDNLCADPGGWMRHVLKETVWIHPPPPGAWAKAPL